MAPSTRFFEDGRLITATTDGKDSIQLWPKLIKGGNVVASQGRCICSRAKDIPLSQRHLGQQDEARRLRDAAAGRSRRQLLRLDLNGRVFSSTAQRYIDRDANIYKLWPIGRDLLVITKDNQRFYYLVKRIGGDLGPSGKERNIAACRHHRGASAV